MAEQRVQRRLAAIVSADVVGYSRLMEADEAGTLARLKNLREEYLYPTVARFGGRIVKTTGDGALIEFSSAVNAVQNAIEVQNELAQRNAATSEDERIAIRIGVNVGDIVIDDDDIYGDGVNIAARLEELAAPGGICISASVYEQISNKLNVEFEDMGEISVKNISRPIHVFRPRLDALETSLGMREGMRPLSFPDKPSIAVLPFLNMSGDPEQEYFADGMVEDIITGLSRIKWLFVIARNSSFIYKGKAVDVKQVGRDLAVRYVLEGSVRRAGNRLRITGQLIEVLSGSHIWAERYDRSIEDIFALQDEITLAVVGAIEPSLRQAEIERVRRKRPDSLDAYDLVLQAMPHVTTLMPKGAGEAIKLLERALVVEPNYALAHGLAAWSHHILYHRAGRDNSHLLASLQHAYQAIAQGPSDAMALTLGGFVISMDKHDRFAAFPAINAAIAVSPSSAFTYFLGGVALAYAGEAERAIEWGEQALRLSPYDPLAVFAWQAKGLGLFKLGRYAESVDAERRAVQANPGFSVCQALLTAALTKSGQVEAAREPAGRVIALEPSFTISGFCRALGIPEPLSGPLSEGMRMAGLPE